ncbi:MAG TPA: PQQ-binding-like beta-propeller repeat protein, partial [Verrucomicrobiota bacterium]|nr:PQQ-binding-like beta-propeller repeat protein [Verrucomicrobiota bacterium]
MKPLPLAAVSWAVPYARSLALLLVLIASLGGHSLHAGTWSRSLGSWDSQETWTSTPPIDAAGRVFLVSSGGAVLALKASDGTEVWRASLGGFVNVETLLTREEYLVIGMTRDSNAFLVALDSSTGKAVWTNAITGNWVTPGATSPDGVVFAASEHSVHAIRSDNGTTLWSRQLAESTGRVSVGDVQQTSLALGHGLVVLTEESPFGNESPRLNALDVASGDWRWTMTNGVSLGAVPASDGTFIVGHCSGPSPWGGCSSDGFSAVNAANGRLVWSRVTPGNTFPTTPSFATTNVALVSEEQADLYRLNSSARSFALVRQLAQWPFLSQPTVAADGTVYITSSHYQPPYSGKLFVLGFTNGFVTAPQSLWQTNLPSYSASPVIAPDGTVVIVTPRPGSVQAFAGSAPLAPTHWPKPRGDMANSACEPSFYAGEPAILLSPTNQVIMAGTSVALPASVKGVRPMAVQWFKDETPLGTPEAHRWFVADSAPADSGVYHFVASNSLGSVTSSPIHLQVNLKLTVGVEGGGRVSQSVAGNVFTNGTIVELEAIPQPGATFLGWSGDIVDLSSRVTVSMTENRRILARFSLVPGNIKFSVRWGQWYVNDRGTPAIGPDGSVYRVYGRNLYVLDGQTGHVRWSYEAPESFSLLGQEPVILDDGAVLVATSTNIVCLDPETHEVRWRLPASSRIGLGPLVYTWRAESRDNQWRYELLAVRPESGSVVWRGAETIFVPEETLIANDDLFLGQGFRYQAITGDLRRSRNPVEGSANAIGRDGVIFGWGPIERRGVVAVDPQSGNIKWRAVTGTQYARGSPPILGPDDTVYAGTEEGRFFAWSGATGIQRWTVRLAPPVRFAAALAEDGTLCVANGTNVSALNAIDGSIRWQTSFTDAFGESEGFATTAPTIGRDGTVYLGTDYGLVAFVGTAPLAQGPWPKHRGDLRNTGRRANFSPWVIHQPVSWMFAEGEEASLQVESLAQPSATIQWFFDNEPLALGTNSSLRLPNFSASQAGFYHAVISNSLGVATTPRVRLFHNDLPRLDFLGIHVTPTQPVTARIETCVAANGSWSLLEEVTFPAGDNLWLDRTGITSPTRLYRLTTPDVVSVRPTRLAGVFTRAPIRPQRTVAFGDPQTGWDSCHIQTHVTLTDST